MKLSGKGKFFLVGSSLAFGGTSGVFSLVYYMLGKGISAAAAGDGRLLARYAIIGILLEVLVYLLMLTSQVMKAFYQADGVLHIQDDMIRNMLHRSLSGFRRKDTAYYMNLFTTDLDMYHTSFLGNLPNLAFDSISILSAVCLLGLISPWLLVTSLALALLPLAVSHLFTGRIQGKRNAYSHASERYTGVLKENLEGYETIRADQGWPALLQRFCRAAQEKYRTLTGYYFTNTMGNSSAWAILMAVQIIEITLAVCLVMKGEVAAGMLVTVSSYVSSITSGAGNMIEDVMNIRSTKDLRRKLKAESTEPCPQASKTALAGEPMVEYEDVSFSFGERKLYEGMSFRFQPGGCYAIVGESGSGKSTLMKLLLQYYDGYSGTIRLAGQDIRQLSEPDLYSMVGVVNQTPYLFNASLYDNITMFTRAPREDSREYGQLLEDLNLTELAARVGDAPLGDFGDNISGGERQRINIARTMRTHPSLVIFDEPTTGLDPENVRLIQEFIFRHDEMTRIVITHDWSEEYLGRFEEVIQIGGR